MTLKIISHEEIFCIKKSPKMTKQAEFYILKKPNFCLYRKVPKEFHLDYDKLEDRPSLPPNMTGGVSSGVPPSSAGSPAPPMRGNMGMQPPISSNMNSGPLPPSSGF